MTFLYEKNTIIVSAIVVLAVLMTAGCSGNDTTFSRNQSDTTSSDIPETTPISSASPEELVAFVEKAYEYSYVYGRETALQEFNNQNGQFVDGELYIFAYDIEGNTLALPFQPDIVGKNRWNATDENGIVYIQDLAAAAESGEGFAHYLYVDASDNFTVKQKLSYVMLIDGEWFIGAGIYDPQDDSPVVKMGTDSQVRGELQSFVEEAIEYAHANGKDAAIAEFNDQNGTFIRDDLYIYVFDYNGTTLSLPYQPQLIGMDLSGLQDLYGVNYTHIEILLAQHGGGFIFYHYPNPSNNMTLEPKMSYVQKVDDIWWVGSGVYLSEITEGDASISSSVSE